MQPQPPPWLPDAPVTSKDRYQWGGEYFINGPRMLEFLGEMRREVRREVGQFAAWVEAQIQVGQTWAVDVAAADAERLMRAAIGRMPPGVVVSFNRLNRAASARIIAAVQDESPLARRLDRRGARAAAGSSSVS